MVQRVYIVFMLVNNMPLLDKVFSSREAAEKYVAKHGDRIISTKEVI